MHGRERWTTQVTRLLQEGGLLGGLRAIRVVWISFRPSEPETGVRILHRPPLHHESEASRGGQQSVRKNEHLFPDDDLHRHGRFQPRLLRAVGHGESQSPGVTARGRPTAGLAHGQDLRRVRPNAGTVPFLQSDRTGRPSLFALVFHFRPPAVVCGGERRRAPHRDRGGGSRQLLRRPRLRNRLRPSMACRAPPVLLRTASDGASGVQNRRRARASASVFPSAAPPRSTPIRTTN